MQAVVILRSNFDNSSKFSKFIDKNCSTPHGVQEL